jgi:hypothetical protein
MDYQKGIYEVGGRMIDPEDPPKEVRQWITRLKRTMKAMPSGIWLFSNGILYIMAEGEDGPMHTGYGEGYDQDYVIDSISETLCDGGDW